MRRRRRTRRRWTVTCKPNQSTQNFCSNSHFYLSIVRLHFLLVTHLRRVMQCFSCQTGFLFLRDTLLHQCMAGIIKCGALTVPSLESRQGCAPFVHSYVQCTAPHCTTHCTTTYLAHPHTNHSGPMGGNRKTHWWSQEQNRSLYDLCVIQR